MSLDFFWTKLLDLLFVFSFFLGFLFDPLQNNTPFRSSLSQSLDSVGIENSGPSLLPAAAPRNPIGNFCVIALSLV